MQISKTDMHTHLGVIDELYLSLSDVFKGKGVAPERIRKTIADFVGNKISHNFSKAARPRVHANKPVELSSLLSYVEEENIQNIAILCDDLLLLAKATIELVDRGRTALPFLWVRHPSHLPDPVPSWLSGFKLHPFLDRFRVNKEDLFPVIRTLQKMDGEDRQGFSLLFHSEDQEIDISRADGFAEVAEAVKPLSVNIIIGHAGGFAPPILCPGTPFDKEHPAVVQEFSHNISMLVQEKIALARNMENIYMDVSCIAHPDKRGLLIEATQDPFTRKKIFFGSDFPLLINEPEHHRQFGTLSSQESLFYPHIGEDGIQDMHANVAVIKKPSVASIKVLKASYQILPQQPFNRPFHPLAREVVEYAKQIDSNVLGIDKNI